MAAKGSIWAIGGGSIWGKDPEQQACGVSGDEKVAGKNREQILQHVFRAMKSRRICSEEGHHVAGLRASLEGKVLLDKEQQ